MDFAYLITATLTLTATLEADYKAQTTLPISGLATYYAPALFQQVYQYRLGSGEVQACPDCLGFVALLRRGDLGRKVWIQRAGEPPLGPLLVVDCASIRHFTMLKAREWVIDLDYELGQRLGMRGPIELAVLERQPFTPRRHREE